MKKKTISPWNNSITVKIIKTLPKLGKLVIVKDTKYNVCYLGKKTKDENFAYNLEDGYNASISFTEDRVWKYLPLIEYNPDVWKPINTLNTTQIIAIFHLPNAKFPVNYILGHLDDKGMICHGFFFKYVIPLKEADYFLELY